MITEITSQTAKIAALQGFLPKASAWEQDFIASVTTQSKAGKTLSDKQMSVVNKILGAPAAKPGKAVTYAPGATVAFNEAVPSRNKKPSVILAIGETKQDGKLRLSRSFGKNYLKVQIWAHGAWQYIGMVTEGDEVKFSGGLALISAVAPDDVVAALEEFAMDVPGSLIKVGKLFGICANCGTPLSHPVSVHMGIGPVCVTLFKSLAPVYASKMALYSAGKDFA